MNKRINEKNLNIRIEEDMIKLFKQTCKNNETNISRELRLMIRSYLKMNGIDYQPVNKER